MIWNFSISHKLNHGMLCCRTEERLISSPNFMSSSGFLGSSRRQKGSGLMLASDSVTQDAAPVEMTRSKPKVLGSRELLN
jgi:hypothetical protein